MASRAQVTTRRERSSRAESGAAVADFAMVSGLLVLLFAAVILIGRSISPRFAQDITESTGSVGGVLVIEVHVRTPLPIFGPLGPEHGLDVIGRAFQENQ